MTKQTFALAVFLALLSPCSLLSQGGVGGIAAKAFPRQGTVAQLPAADGTQGMRIVTDGASATDCSGGGGAAVVVCLDIGSWLGLPQSGGAGASTADAVSITDAGDYFSGTDVEAALQQVGPTMTDARTPTAHESSHLQGGADALSGTLTVDITGNAATATSATTASSATTATTASALAADPAACTSGDYVSDMAADGTLTCGTPASGTGDVVGPSSASDNAVARWDATTGKLLQNSSAGPFVSDTGNINLSPATGTTSSYYIYDGYRSAAPGGNNDDSTLSLPITTSISTPPWSGAMGLKQQGVSCDRIWAIDRSQRKTQWSSHSTDPDQGTKDTAAYRGSAGVVKLTNALQLTPIASPPVTCGDANTEGTIYSDDSHALCWCNGTAWVVIGGAGACS